MKVIVYADFNCVYCYLASQRADRLTREGTAEVEWRAIEHLPRLPVTGYKPRPGELQPGDAGGKDDLAEAACLALSDEWLPASLPDVISNTRAAVSAYVEAITDGVQDRLRLRLFEAIWAQGRNMSSPEEVRRVITDLLWPVDPLYLHLISPDLPTPVLHDPDPMRIVRREGGTVTPDGGPLTTVAYDRARQWRQEWLALSQSALSRSALSQSAPPEPAVPAVIGPDGAVHAGPDGLRCLADPGADLRGTTRMEDVSAAARGERGEHPDHHDQATGGTPMAALPVRRGGRNLTVVNPSASRRQ